MENNEHDEDSIVDISISNTPSFVWSTPMWIEIRQVFDLQGRLKRFHIMFAHVKDYDVMKDTKTTDEGLIIFCPFSNSDPIL